MLYTLWDTRYVEAVQEALHVGDGGLHLNKAVNLSYTEIKAQNYNSRKKSQE